MARLASIKRKETGHAAACRYCRGGMYWDYQERCWLCILCGYREHNKSLKLKRMAEVVTARVWNEIFGN